MEIEIHPSVFDIALTPEQLILVRERFARAKKGAPLRAAPSGKGKSILVLVENSCRTGPGPEALKALRSAARLTKSKAADAFNVSLTTWKAFEEGNQDIPKAAFDFLRREAGGLRLLFPE